MNFTAEVQRLGDEIELAYGHSLPAGMRVTFRFSVQMVASVSIMRLAFPGLEL